MRRVNERKSLRLKNTTKYFDPNTSRIRNMFGSPHSFQSRRIKIEGYESRLYWQFRYCQDVGGQTFFYTLTYNNKSMPKYMNQNCFDYEDLRGLLTGAFRKVLLRKYGTVFKYFVGAELGDGKGKRGMHNNPHYHILFFLESANSDIFPYKLISPEEFRHYIRIYWQGFDQDEDRKNGVFHDFRKCGKGIAKEGENVGKVFDFRACCYVSKYVCKDAKLKMHEEQVAKRLRYKFKGIYKLSSCLHLSFIDNVLRRKRFLYNSPFRAEMSSLLKLSNAEFLYKLCPNAFRHIESAIQSQHYIENSSLDSFVTDEVIAPYVRSVVAKYHLWDKYNEFVRQWIDEQVKRGVIEYRNRYTNKCRISHGVGDYALQHIFDKDNPTIQVPSKDGFKERPLSLYYYRKLFTDVVIDKKGSPIRVLNGAGLLYKLNRLHKQIDRKVCKAKADFVVLVNSPVLYEKMYSSDVNTEVSFHFDRFIREYGDCFKTSSSLSQVLYRYAYYKLVYEDRCFPVEMDGSTGTFSFPPILVDEDYRKFLNPSFYSVSRSDTRLDSFLDSGMQGYLPYSQHPYFLRYLGLFRVLDMCSDYLFVQNDRKEQEEAQEIARVKRFHNQRKLIEFYNSFNY